MLKCFTHQDGKSPQRFLVGQGRRSTTIERPWGSTVRTVSKPVRALEEHSLQDITVLWTPSVKKLDLPAVQEVEAKCRALADTVSSETAAIYSNISNAGLSHPADVSVYLTLRELDDKGRREVPEHRLKVIDFGVKAMLG